MCYKHKLNSLDSLRMRVFGVLKTSKNKTKIIKHISSLNENEKQILRSFYKANKKRLQLDSSDANVQDLKLCGILIAGSWGNDDGWSYNISDFAFDYIRKNEDVLDGETDCGYVNYRTIQRMYR